MKASLSYLVVGLSLVSLSLKAQTTQGLISGRVVDSLSGKPIDKARIVVFSPTTNVYRATLTNASGSYVLPMLSPGLYQVNAEASGFQTAQVNELELPVAATLTLPFRLRALSNVWERDQHRSVFFPGNSVLLFYGPDVDTSRTGNFEPTLGMRGMLETSISQVIDPGSLRNLPLTRRDVYSLLVTLPGVTTDTSTGRGLGISVNGQRPSSSNFLLDGMENNNYLITGPLASIAPEAVQEYRISTNNYSPEYGGTSGFLANAVTRTGGNQWHGVGYLNFQNEALDANDYQRNSRSLPRTLNRNWQPGFSAGGPLRANRLFASGSFEYQRFRSSGEPELLRLPTKNFVPQSEFARQLLSGFDAPEGPGQTLDMTVTPPASLNRYFVVPRLDYLVDGGKQRLLTRAVVVHIERPDFIWTPYRSFSSPLTQQAVSAMGGWLATFGSFTNEARAGLSSENLRFDRAQSEIPVLASEDGTLLPGSPAFYSFRNRSRSWEFVENLSWVRERHTLKFGGGGLIRSLSGYLTAGGDGYYAFRDLERFGRNEPRRVQVALSRTHFNSSYQAPDYDREYRNRQVFFFAQDSFRLTERLVVNFGARYENFGAPSNVGQAKDSMVVLGNGSSLADQLGGASVQPGPTGDQPVYGGGGNWEGRAGVSWSLRNDARTLLRASYGVFHDRPFDNLWQNVRNNSVVLSTTDWTNRVVVPVADILPSLKGLNEDVILTRLYMFPNRLAAPRTHSYFAGVSHEFSRSLIVEANASGALGRELITTDFVNRDFSDLSASGRGRFNPALPSIYYRSNDGFSDYHGLGISARYRTRRIQLHLAYTWSHSIDNQSEPLAGDFYDLLLTRTGANSGSSLPARFSEQFNAYGDRGNSDFDQRHNLVWFGIWDLPQPASRSSAAAWLRNWRVSTLMAFRTGFPYTVTTASAGPILNRRLDLVNAPLLEAPRTPAEEKGGVLFFDPAAFARPRGLTIQGNTGRNALAGPGLYSVDFSLSRTWSSRILGEGGRVTLRVDVFNLLNHANLGNPDTLFQSPDFGIARYGRKGRQSSFPALTPFDERGRQLQLLLRIEF